MKKYNVISVVLFMFLCGCSVGDYGAEKLYWKATKEYSAILKKAGQVKPLDFQKVITLYREVIAKYPDWNNTANAYFNISRLYVIQKEYDLAILELEKLKEKFYRNPDICSNADFTIALIYEEQGKWEESLEYLKIVETAYPQTYSAFLAPLFMARHYKKSGEVGKWQQPYQDAISKYKAIIAQNPNSLNALAALDFVIMALVEQGTEEKAFVYLEEIIEGYPGSLVRAKALFSKSLIYEREAKFDKAISSLEEIIKDFPNTALSKAAQEQIEKIESGIRKSESRN